MRIYVYVCMDTWMWINIYPCSRLVGVDVGGCVRRVASNDRARGRDGWWGTFRNLVRNKWFNDYRWLSHVQHHAHHNKHGVGCEFAGGPLLYKWPRNRTTTNIATTACIDQDTNRPMCTRHGNATPAKRFDELQLVHVGEVYKLNTFHRADCFEYPANLRNFGRHFGRCRKTWKRLEDILEDVIWPRECLEDVVIIFKIKNF